MNAASTPHLRTTTALLLAAGTCLTASALLDAQQAVVAGPPSDALPRTVDYERDVKPILRAKCFGCHGPKQAQSGLRLDLRQSALRGGDYGVVIVPGRASESALIQRLTGSSAGLQMPPDDEPPVDEEEIRTLQAWIDQGADMPGNALERESATRPTDPAVLALLEMIGRHDIDAVRRRLAADASLARAADSSGSTLLMHASYMGTVAIMRALLDAGAEVNAANARKATALHWAVPDPEKVRLLLAHGAHVDAATVEKRTPLYLAAMLPEGVAAARLLLEAGADVAATTVLGTTPLFPAATTSAEMTALLLHHGADPNVRARSDATPILVTRGVDVVRLLLAHGADARARSKTGDSSLMEAAIRGDAAAAALLLEHGADVNAADHRGYTPLLLAAQHDGDSPALVRLLLDHGADLDATAEGETALSLAAQRGETAVTILLREARGARAAAVRSR